MPDTPQDSAASRPRNLVRSRGGPHEDHRAAVSTLDREAATAGGCENNLHWSPERRCSSPAAGRYRITCPQHHWDDCLLCLRCQQMVRNGKIACGACMRAGEVDIRVSMERSS